MASYTRTVKLTGERPIEGKTPDSLLALHEAGYREVLARIGPGRFLDVGCGLGDGSATFLAPERDVVGVDYDPDTAAHAHRLRPALHTACCDGAVTALRAESFDWVCSSHLIEHFADPQPHVHELARVLKPGGTAFFITPNKPADFENPYHLSLFGPEDLAAMLRRHFEGVTVFGLDGDAVVKADFARRRTLARKLLALDVFDLRHRLPRRWYVGLHAAARRLAYPIARRGAADRPAITSDRFSLVDSIDDTTLVLFAVARQPVVATSSRSTG